MPASPHGSIVKGDGESVKLIGLGPGRIDTASNGRCGVAKGESRWTAAWDDHWCAADDRLVEWARSRMGAQSVDARSHGARQRSG
jgi:hypothetical protein